MNQNQYAKYYDWEFELICTRQKHDVKLWKSLAERYGSPILDVCCGSGRITQELAKSGYEVTALDNCPEMLEILEDKRLKNVKTVLADMRNFTLDRKFNFAFISYSSFQQLLNLEDQIDCLETIRKHLTEDGVLGIDINPHVLEGLEIQKKEVAYIADFPRHQSRITMFTSHRIDRINQIKHWNDTYVEVFPNGEKTEFINRESLKECSMGYMKILFGKCDYEIVDVFGDFDGGKVTKDSENVIWVVKPLDSSSED
jgi:ubiquinone/menaquinone biosynthesis C-methylase UbiE